MKALKFFFKITVFFFICLNLALAQNKENIQVTDLLKLKQVTQLAINPTNKNMVLYTIKQIVPDATPNNEYKYDTQLWLNDGKENRQLTFLNNAALGATWAANGQYVYFKRINSEGKIKLMKLPVNGGEAQPIMEFKYGIDEYKLAGDSLVFFTAIISENDMLNDSLFISNKLFYNKEKPGINNFETQKTSIKPNANGSIEEIRAYLAENEKKNKVKVINNQNFQNESTTYSQLSFSALFCYNIASQKFENIETNFSSVNNLRLAIKTGELIYMLAPQTEEHPQRSKLSQMVIYDIKTKTKQIPFGYVKGNFRFEVDETGQKFVVQNNEFGEIGFQKIKLWDRSSKKEKFLNFDRNPSSIQIKNNQIYINAQSEGGQKIYVFDEEGNKTNEIGYKDEGILNFDLFENKLVYAKTNIEKPSDIYEFDLISKQENILTNLHPWLVNKNISKPVKGTFANEKGLNIDYWIMPPIQVEAGKKYPLLLNMHGGPTAMWGPGEASMWHEFQYFCAKGYGIVYANPRGSGGYGNDFQKANYKDWGVGPAFDVLTATEIAMKKSWADTSKMVITGGSYAGYLTAWIIAHDHRFKAAFAARGVYDLTTFMGEGNAWKLVPDYFGLPWEPTSKAILQAQSPYTFIDKIKTPLAIKHGENDLRTGVIQSEMMYKSLKILNKPVEYLRYPGGTHELSRSGDVSQRIDRLLRIYEFFERFVGEK